MAVKRRRGKVCPVSGKRLSQVAPPVIAIKLETKKARHGEPFGFNFGFSQEAEASAGSGSSNQDLQRMKVSGNQTKGCQSDLPGLSISSQFTGSDPPEKITGAATGLFRRDGKTDGLWRCRGYSGQRRKKLTKILDLPLGEGQFVDTLPTVTVDNRF